MTTQHTPTPFNWHGPYMTGAYKISAMDGEDKLALRLYIEPSSNAKADAAFIVRACNAHDELVAALRAIADSLQTADTYTERDGWEKAHDKFAAFARAALAKVGA